MRRMLRRVLFAGRRPDLAVRRLRGLEVDGISIEEIERTIGPPRTVFEAGACDGRDTVRMATAWPSASIYALEPIPSAYRVAAQAAQHLDNVDLRPLALSARIGTDRMHVSSWADGSPRPHSSSLLKPTRHTAAHPTIVFRETVEVETLTLDAWLGSTNETVIDLLWLDLQGSELSVLRASPDALKRIRAVHMEVSREELYEKSPTYFEVLDWMASEGFKRAIDRVPAVSGNILFIRSSPNA